MTASQLANLIQARQTITHLLGGLPSTTHDAKDLARRLRSIADGDDKEPLHRLFHALHALDIGMKALETVDVTLTPERRP